MTAAIAFIAWALSPPVTIYAAAPETFQVALSDFVDWHVSI
jgi:hypothetical protein